MANDNYDDIKPYEQDDEVIAVREDYGFKANVRQRISDIVRRIEFLEKIGIMWAVTVSRVITFVFSLAAVGVLDFILLTNDATRTRFIMIPVLMLSASLLILLSRACMIDPSYGSLLKSSYILFTQQLKRQLIRMGRIKRPRKTKIHDVVSKPSSINNTFGDKEGNLVLFSNGDYGTVLIIDGMSSATAYPSEIKSQEDTAMNYHNGRKNRKTTEIHITSSQKQNTEQQLKNLESRIRSTTDPAIKSLIMRQHLYLNEFVNGEKPTIIQHLILRDPSREGLLESVERLGDYVFNYNYYYSIGELDQKDAKRVLSDFYSFR